MLILVQNRGPGTSEGVATTPDETHAFFSHIRVPHVLGCKSKPILKVFHTDINEHCKGLALIDELLNLQRFRSMSSAFSDDGLLMTAFKIAAPGVRGSNLLVNVLIASSRFP